MSLILEDTHHLSKVDKNALNVDALAYLADRMIPGTRVPITDIPELFRDELSASLLQMEDENNTVDMVLILRKILYNEFGGISL